MTTSRSLLCLLGGATLLFAASAASAQTVVRIGLNDDPDTLDPTLSPAFVTRFILTIACDKLFDIDSNLKLVPRLAESSSWSDDGKSLTLKLRPNVVFQDGEPFDAEAVRYNLDRHLNMVGSLRKTDLVDLESVEVLDPLTVKINLKRPSAPFESVLADRAGMMMSPKAAEALGDKLGTAPVCAGPFKFVSRVPQGQIVFEKFEDYWDKANIHVDRVEFLAVNDPTVRLASLQSGEFDIIERLSPKDAPQVEQDDRLQLLTAPDIGYSFIHFNVGKPPRSETLGDAKVRKAIDLAIDRQTLVDVAFDGKYIAGDQHFAPSSPYHVDRPVKKRDVERAKELLKEAGKENLTFELNVRPDRDFQVAAQVIQQMLSEAGINMVLNTLENVTQMDQGRQGNFDAMITFWSGRVDPDGNVAPFLTCKASLNFMGYCNEQFDALLMKARQTLDPEERKKIYAEAMAIRDEAMPDVVLWYRQLFGAASAKLENVHLLPDGHIRLQGVKKTN